MSDKLGTILHVGMIQAAVLETAAEIDKLIGEALEEQSMFIKLHDRVDGIECTVGIMHLAHYTPARPARPMIDTASGVPMIGLNGGH